MSHNVSKGESKENGHGAAKPNEAKRCTGESLERRARELRVTVFCHCRVRARVRARFRAMKRGLKRSKG